VPALFAAKASRDDVTSAVRVTSSNEVALDGALAVFDCLTMIADGTPKEAALAKAAQDAAPALSKLLNDALSRDQYEPLAVAEHFGLPCHIPQGLPVAWHIVRHAPDFEQAIRGKNTLTTAVSGQN